MRFHDLALVADLQVVSELLDLVGIPQLGDVLYWRPEATTEPASHRGLAISGARRVRALHPESASAVGQMLIDTNAASMNRAGNQDKCLHLRLPPPRRVGDLVEIFKAIDGYE